MMGGIAEDFSVMKSAWICLGSLGDFGFLMIRFMMLMSWFCSNTFLGFRSGLLKPTLFLN